PHRRNHKAHSDSAGEGTGGTRDKSLESHLNSGIFQLAYQKEFEVPVRFLNPNYHVILIHYPLGVFVLGVILEMFSFFWRKSSVRSAARWMILLGALLSIPAATSGIAALDEV